MAAAIAHVVVRISQSQDFATLKLLIVFSLTGLVLTLASARLGLDASWAFF
jgi:hypothetical protein